MLILLALLFLIGLIMMVTVLKPTSESQKKEGVLVELNTDYLAELDTDSLARLNTTKDLMNNRHKLKDYFEPVKVRKPSAPPKEMFEPDLIDIEEEPVLDPNAICRLTGLPINKCGCENCKLLKQTKR